jgi:CHAT domain-containing protein
MATIVMIHQIAFRAGTLRKNQTAHATLRKTKKMRQRNLLRAVPSPPVNLERQSQWPIEKTAMAAIPAHATLRKTDKCRKHNLVRVVRTLPVDRATQSLPLRERNLMAAIQSIRQKSFQARALRENHTAQPTLQKTDKCRKHNLVLAVPGLPADVATQNLLLIKKNAMAGVLSVRQNTVRAGALRRN